ncbi:MAG: DnaJ C-terminal domain-containing protein [Candidatus Gracilibacteria bacterium]|nr:DnaJ C-terminal domain-containing protein [Candidatus Gracilibacteria bacterium]
MDFYSILEIEKGASKEEIKKAYRKLAMQYHPDRNAGDKTAEEKFKQINEAYSTLSDDAKRQQYDMFGKAGGAGGNPFGGGFGGGVDVDLGDIFESFFGRGFGGQAKKRKTTYAGEDIETNINIDLKTSIYGGKEKVKFNKKETCVTCDGEGGKGKTTCSKCNGRGQITYTTQSMFGTIQQTGTCDACSGTGETFSEVCSNCHGEKRKLVKKEIDVDIPAGIDDGMIIKMSGEGNSGVGTRQSGDLYIRFGVKLEEKELKRDGVNLYYELEIDVLEAILGTKKEINIPVIGKRNIEIKAGTQPETIIKISGDGVKHIDSDSKGDLFINLSIKIPKKLGKTERELYEKIAKEKKLNVNKSGVFEKIFG